MLRVRRQAGGKPWGMHILDFVAVLLLAGCASVQTQSTAYGNQTAGSEPSEEKQEEYTGPKKLVQVIRFGIPAEVLKKYKELGDKRVGWGLCNRIVDELYDTNRFDYIEDKEEFLKRVLELWTAEEAGVFFRDDDRKPPKPPDYLVYAEVFDFGVSHQERIVGTKKREVAVTKIGVQIRFVDTQTMQYTPASATGEAVLKKSGNIWAGLDDFDGTQVGIAAEQAIKDALKKALKRLDRRR